MRSVISTGSLARSSARHPKRVLGIWLLLLVVVGGIGFGTIQDVVVRDWTFINTPESARGFDLIEERFGFESPTEEAVIVRSDTASVDDPAFQEIVTGLTADLRGLEGLVTSAVNVYEARAAGNPGAGQLVSTDQHSTLIPVSLISYDVASDRVDELLDTLAAAEVDGFDVLTVGSVSFFETQWKISEEDLTRAEMIGIPIALIILVVVMRALVGAGVPLMLAIGSIGVATGIAAIIARATELSFYVSNMISLIGLAVGIDYALFIVERYREERTHGLDKIEAITRTGATSSRAVLISGITVVLALLGLFMIPTTIFSSLGTGAVLVVLVAVAAMLTLVPALLSLLGDRINWPYWKRDAPKSGKNHGFTAMLTQIVLQHPVLAMLLSAGVLLLMSVPVLDMRTGMAGVEALPESDTRTAMSILSTEFSPGLVAPIQIVVDAARSAEVDAQIDALSQAMSNHPGLAGPATVQWNEQGDTAWIVQRLAVDATSEVAYETVIDVRESLVPAAFGTSSNAVYVTGDSAYRQDFFQVSDERTIPVFIFVLGLSFLILLMAFRSLVVPVKAIIMNLLSVGAAYGMLVFVFQKGHGAGLLGFTRTPVIEAWIPIFLFCVLFGLSMDYHVFLLSRIREFFEHGHANRESVAQGLQATARIITGAALIMVAVFAGFATGELVMMQQMGFGLAVAVLLDATVVRSVLVPATMALLGERNWYLPAWLNWIPDLRMEAERPPVGERHSHASAD